MPAKRWPVRDVIALIVTVFAASCTIDVSSVRAATCSGVDVASSDSIQDAVDSHAADTTFCLSGSYTTAKPIIPKDGDRFIGSSGTNISTSGSVVFSGGKHVTYRNLGIGPSRGDGLRPGDASKIVNSRIHDNPKCGITTIANRLVIHDNKIVDNGSTDTTPISQACGLKIRGAHGSDSGAYSTISGNVVHDNVHTALWVDCDGHDNVFARNVVYRNTGIALDEETSYRNTFRHNIVRHNGFGMKQPAVSILDSIGGVFKKNTFANNYRGVHIWADRRATVSSPHVGAGCADASVTGYIPSHISVRGNRFTTEQRVGFAPHGVKVSAARFNWNCYTVLTAHAKNWQLPRDSTATWRQWRRAGQDRNGVKKTTTC